MSRSLRLAATVAALLAPTLAAAQESQTRGGPPPADDAPPATLPEGATVPATDEPAVAPVVPAGDPPVPAPGYAPAYGPAPVAAVSAAPTEPLPYLTLTVSPVHLILGMVEGTLELRIAPRFGLAGVVGGGAMTAGDVTATVFEIGGSGRYYVSGDFRSGVQLGAELLFASASASSSNEDLSAFGAGLTLGGFVGYKKTWASGFTFDGQAGVQTLAVAAETNQGDRIEESRMGLLLNLNVGWSF
jgi:hypothetical protein